MVPFSSLIVGFSGRSSKLLTSHTSVAVAAALASNGNSLTISPFAARCSSSKKSQHGDKKVSDLDSLHIPVMEDEVLKLWVPGNSRQASISGDGNGYNSRSGIRLIDGTLGMAGHTLAAIKQAEAESIQMRVLGIDRDDSALAKAKKRAKWHLNNESDDTTKSGNEDEQKIIDVGESLYESRVVFHHGSFSDISPNLLNQNSFPPKVDGILIDLGMNSHQIDNASRGFTFRKHGPLDMRFDTTSASDKSKSKEESSISRAITVKAKDIINTWSASEMSLIFKKYADEPYAYTIAANIVEWRKSKSQARENKNKSAGIGSTLELRYIIEEAVESAAAKEIVGDDRMMIGSFLKGNKDKRTKKSIFSEYAAIWKAPPQPKKQYGKQKNNTKNNTLSKKKKENLLRKYEERKLRHPNHVMRCFQALRIAVNNELEHIQSFFQSKAPLQCLEIGGRLVMIAFHPGEDELVREEMKKMIASGEFKLLTPEDEGLRPTLEEIKVNGRSRTARVRAVERIRLTAIEPSKI